jgi:hypothetical protein
MDDLAELQLRRARVQGEINRYLEAPADNDDERTRLLLETALLKREIIDIKIALINSTDVEEIKGFRGQIQTKEQQIETNKVLLHGLIQLRLLPPKTKEIRPSNSPPPPPKLLLLLIYCAILDPTSLSFSIHF